MVTSYKNVCNQSNRQIINQNRVDISVMTFIGMHRLAGVVRFKVMHDSSTMYIHSSFGDSPI